jgi:tRNA A-37 threonylcarbamoyl transferase component Bud32/tetratricopeptide (TPR) repeat protein
MACPDTRTLIDLVVAALEDEVAARVTTHVSTCASCRAAVEQLDAETDPGEVDAASTLRIGRRSTEPPAAERFTLGGELGRGGMARVVLARDPRLGRQVALKVAIERGRVAELRLTREATIAARLDHPSILPIYERGKLPTGEAFVAMRRAVGPSLERALRDAPNLDTRLTLLPHVLAVADALAHAHERHVIHRDVTPNNVMIDRYGDTQLIDWGLARDRTRVESSAAATASSDPLVTREGSVMGTAPFMAPEQARGEPVDQRVDVYAIGAMIYRLVGGAPPYRGDTDQVLAAVRAGPPQPLLARAPRSPPELVAIVERAMARDAADRYANAGELAVDLRKFVDGRMVEAYRYPVRVRLARWARRHRSALGAAIAAMIVVAVSSVVGVRAMVHARDQAIASGQASDRLLWFVVRDLRLRLATIGRLELLEDLLAKVEDHDRDGELSGDPTERTARRGELLVARALIAERRGFPDQAIARCREVLILGTTAGDDVAWRERRATCHLQLGSIALDRGDREAAEASYLRGLAEEMAAQATGHNVWSNSPAQGLGRIGDLELFEQPRRALVWFALAAAVAERGAIAHPDDPMIARDQMAIQVKIADAHDSLDDAENAAAAFARAAALGETWLRHAKTNADAARDQALLDQRRAVIHARLGRGDALTLLDRAHQGWTALAARDPGDLHRQEDLLLSWTQVAQVVVATDPARAVAADRAAIAIGERLIAGDPANTRWREDLCGAHLGIGDAALALEDYSGARDGYRACERIAEQLLSSQPRVPKWLGFRAMARYGLAWTEFRAKRPHPILRATYHAWVAATLDAAAVDTTGRWDSFLVEAYTGLAELAIADHDWTAATAELDDASRAMARIDARGGAPASKRWIVDYFVSVRAALAKSRR